MRLFAGEWVGNVLTRLGMQEGEAIESRMVSRRIQAAQKKVEEYHFESRKNLLEYDEVMDTQRKRTYGKRQEILNDANCKAMILEMIEEQVNSAVGRFLNPDYGAGELPGVRQQPARRRVRGGRVQERHRLRAGRVRSPATRRRGTSRP